MLKNDFLSVHCFPEKAPEIISVFARILEMWKGFNLKKIGLPTYRHTHIIYMEVILSYNNNG